MNEPTLLFHQCSYIFVCYPQTVLPKLPMIMTIERASLGLERWLGGQKH